jgi:hypothetical protein
MKNSKKQVQKKWNKNRAENWSLFMPPARPSQGEMVQYEKGVIKYGLNNLSRWALLGGTPEIRSLAAQYKKHLLCIDRSEEVLKALATMVNPHFSEEFLCENWLDLNIPESVDLVFADGSLNMLNNEQHKSFIKKIYSILSPHGWVALRVHLAEPPKFSTLQEVFEWRRTHNSHEPVFSSTRTHLDMLWMEPETLKISFIDYHKRICTLNKDGLISHEEFLGYNTLLKFNKIELFYIRRKFFEKIIANYFVIKEVYDGNDYSRSIQHPIYFLQKI